MSAGFPESAVDAVGTPNSLFRSSLSAVKLNLIFGFLKLVTVTSPLSLVSSNTISNVLLANSFLISVCVFKLKDPFAAPLGKLGSLIFSFPTSFGMSKMSASILPLNGDEKVPVTTRLPCVIDKSPVMPVLWIAFGEPCIFANTILTAKSFPLPFCASFTVTLSLFTLSCSMLIDGAFKLMLFATPLKLPETRSCKLSIKNALFSVCASTSPVALISTSDPSSSAPWMELSSPFTLKRLLPGSYKKVPLIADVASTAGWLVLMVKLVSKSTGSPKAIWLDVKLKLLTLYCVPCVSSA